MTPKVNPFIYGPPVPPEKFIGRDREVDIILDRLANPYNRGGSTVSGASGIGKTSLLHCLQAQKTRKQWAQLSPEASHFVYIPTGIISPFSEIGFWEFLFSELEEWLGSRAGLERISEALEAGKAPSRVNISRFFTRLGSDKNKFVVVLLDGFDLLMGEINKDTPETGLGFLHTLRSLLNLPSPRGFSLVTSSELELYDLFEDVPWFGSGFYSNMANFPLPPFNETQIEALIDAYLAGTGISFNEAERNGLKESSQGHPQKLQQAAHLLFEQKVIGKGETKMSSPEQQFAVTVLSQAVGFLFDEARKVLAERRQRRQEMEEADDTTALPVGAEETAKEKILELKPTNLDEETGREIEHLLKLIEIQTNHRRKAEIKINKLGGILFVPPNVRVELEHAEEEILKHSQKLKKLLEKAYNQPIHIDGLE